MPLIIMPNLSENPPKEKEKKKRILPHTTNSWLKICQDNMIISEDSRNLSKQCKQIMSLETFLESDTVVYGTMFTLENKNDPITIETFEIFINPLGTNIDIKIYTKSGDFVGLESESSQWTKIVDTSLFPAREGRGTIIPTTQFEKVTMEGTNEIRAFFISCKTADLRYKRDEIGRDVGETFLSDDFLSLQTGIGISEYGFGNQIVPSRLFTGIIHYSHQNKCTDKLSQAIVSYSFNTQVSASELDELNYMLDYSIANILSTSLSTFRDEFKLEIESTTCTESVLEEGKSIYIFFVSRDKTFSSIDCSIIFLFYGECVEDATDIVNCTVVDCQLVVNHRNTISPGNVKFLLLQQASNVTEWMHQGRLEIEYVGMETMTAQILLTLEGISGTTTNSDILNDEQKHYIEDVITSFLEEMTMSQSNAVVLGANITSQRGHGSDHVDDNRSLKQMNNCWVELSVDVFAAYSSPYTGNVQFEMIIISSFRSQASDFIYDLTTRHYLPDSKVKGASSEIFSRGIHQILVSSLTNPIQNETKGGGPPNGEMTLTSLYGLDSFVFVGLCCGVIFLMCAWLCICTTKSKSDPMESNGIILIDSSGKRRHRASVIFRNAVDLKSSTNQKGLLNQKVGEAVMISDNHSLTGTVHSCGMEDTSSYAYHHDTSYLHDNEDVQERSSQASSDCGLHRSNHSSNLHIKDHPTSRDERLYHETRIREFPHQERLECNWNTQSSHHARTLDDIKSTHDSRRIHYNHQPMVNSTH
jgi:hypothetical protein